MNITIRYTVLISLIVALGGFLLGFDSAVISGAVPFIKNYFVLDDIELGWAVSCLILGAITGNMVAGPLSDKFGRKKVLIVTAVLFAISAVSSALATDFTFFIFARLLGGIGVGGAILIAPVYIAEIAPPDQRGKLVSFNQLNIVIGISAAYFSNYFLLDIGADNWRWMLGVEAIPAILYFISLFSVPESPRWLIRKGFDDIAKAIMERVGGKEHAQKAYAAIRDSLSADKVKARFGELFQSKMRLIMFIAFAITFFQQITGINAVLYYAPSIFQKAGGGTESAFVQAVVVGLINLSFTIVAMYLIDRLGRKPLLMIGTATMTISLFVLMTAFNQANYRLSPVFYEKLSNENLPKELITELENYAGKNFESEDIMLETISQNLDKAYVTKYKTKLVNNAIELNTFLVLLAILAYVASFAISLGPVMWVLLSEIFPNKLRGMAISIAGLFNSIVSFTVTLVFPWELENLGATGTFMIYGVFAALAFVFVKFVIVETKGKTLEEIEQSLVKL